MCWGPSLGEAHGRPTHVALGTCGRGWKGGRTYRGGSGMDRSKHAERDSPCRRGRICLWASSCACSTLVSKAPGPWLSNCLLLRHFSRQGLSLEVCGQVERRGLKTSLAIVPGTVATTEFRKKRWEAEDGGHSEGVAVSRKGPETPSLQTSASSDARAGVRASFAQRCVAQPRAVTARGAWAGAGAGAGKETSTLPCHPKGRRCKLPPLKEHLLWCEEEEKRACRCKAACAS